MLDKCSELGYDNYFEVGKVRLGVDLAVIWCTEMMAEVKSYSKHHIDRVVHIKK